MKVLFMGTPDFANDCLSALVEKGHEVVGVFSQPDKPKGRKQELAPPPVKVLAESLGLFVYQPKTLKDGEAMRVIERLNPDIIVVVAYGKILPKEVLSYPKYGCVNIHASLLPHLRGASPINFSIINGDTATGITSMYMDEGLDTGDMLIRREVDILPDMTAGELFDILAPVGAEVLIETLEKIENGTIKRVPQDNAAATYAPIMDKSTGKIDFAKTAEQVHNLVRGTEPWPGAYCIMGNQTLKICKTKVLKQDFFARPGEVIFADRKSGIVIACAENAIEVLELQLQGKKRLSAKDFLNGSKMAPGLILE